MYVFYDACGVLVTFCNLYFDLEISLKMLVRMSCLWKLPTNFSAEFCQALNICTFLMVDVIDYFTRHRFYYLIYYIQPTQFLHYVSIVSISNLDEFGKLAQTENLAFVLLIGLLYRSAYCTDRPTVLTGLL